MNINGSNERPRDVYADLKHAAAYVADHIARSGVEAFRSRTDLLALTASPALSPASQSG
jgi:hypothetical protein